MNVKTCVTALRVVLALAVFPAGLAAQDRSVLMLPDANSHETYFTIHNLRAAQQIARGSGVKVGILDHYFGFADHADLYAGGENFLPTDGREPDLNILQFDYSRVFVDKLLRWQSGQASGIGNHPFLSISSTSPVTAGLVALLLSVNPLLEPKTIKRLLVETSRPVTLEGMTGRHVPDVLAALRRVRRAH